MAKKSSGKTVGHRHFKKAQAHRAAGMGLVRKGPGPVGGKRVVMAPQSAPPPMNSPAMPPSTFGNSGLTPDPDNDGM